MDHHLVRAGFRVPDLAASLDHAVALLGLETRHRDAERADLALPGQPVCLVLRSDTASSFDFMALGTTEENLTEVRRRLADLGVPSEPGRELAGDAVRFHAPNGVAVEVGVAERPVRNEQARTGGPVIGSIDHLSFSAEDPGAFARFFIDVLGFRLSDSFRDQRHWLRCSSSHHTVAVFSGADGLHHYAFETTDIRGLAALGDLLAERDENFLWGPGRHGLGRNIFSYTLDPAGSILEVTSDMLQLGDDWEPQVWSDAAKSGVLWGPTPPAGFRDRFVPASRDQEAVR